MEFIDGGITAPRGFLAAGVEAGIRKKGKKDVALIYSDSLCTAAAVYTVNKFKAAPLQISQKNLVNNKAQAIVINSGVANACMGKQGLESAQKMTEITSQFLKINPEDVVVASTGLIGVPLPMDKLEKGVKDAVSKLSPQGNSCAAEAIMTTDTVKKEVAVKLQLGGKWVTIGAMAKGSGMIHPNMATMLGFITTDAKIEEKCLQKVIKEVTDTTFNMISVDGDTSTNDMVVILANGKAENPEITVESELLQPFQEAVSEVCTLLAKMIARDGEGATKLIEVEVTGAESLADARKAARAISASNLVKTAIFGEDANWGRIITALGYSGAEVDPLKVDVYIGDLLVAEKGTGLNFDEDKAYNLLKEKEIKIKVALNKGEYKAKAWSCDLTYEYIRINGEYRT